MILAPFLFCKREFDFNRALPRKHFPLQFLKNKIHAPEMHTPARAKHTIHSDRHNATLRMIKLNTLTLNTLIIYIERLGNLRRLQILYKGCAAHNPIKAARKKHAVYIKIRHNILVRESCISKMQL